VIDVVQEATAELHEALRRLVLRAHGVGESLTAAALEIARREGAMTVDLTSRPSREDANRLYRRIGFEQRDTNVYRYTL
jgi:ribosomal protein S18 acetylase RimI-like enzyme